MTPFCGAKAPSLTPSESQDALICAQLLPSLHGNLLCTYSIYSLLLLPLLRSAPATLPSQSQVYEVQSTPHSSSCQHEGLADWASEIIPPH